MGAAVKLRYYPYGQEMGSVTDNDTAKFGTYTRDGATGLDYAMNRYYQSTWGRFTSPDPYRASGGPGDPGSWMLTWAVASFYPRGDLAMGRASPYDVRDGHR
jgi:RHS repeat-associated protein